MLLVSSKNLVAANPSTESVPITVFEKFHPELRTGPASAPYSIELFLINQRHGVPRVLMRLHLSPGEKTQTKKDSPKQEASAVPFGCECVAQMNAWHRGACAITITYRLHAARNRIYISASSKLYQIIHDKSL